MPLIDSLKKDIHYIESLNSCMNCGVCTAICPSAEFYNYDPRRIADTVQRQDEESIEGLLKSDTIWYCGECMSCKTRCPRCEYTRRNHHGTTQIITGKRMVYRI